MSVSATAQIRNDVSSTPYDVVMAKTTIATTRMVAPAANEMERPKRSATAPVGTSSTVRPSRKAASAIPTCVSEKPRSMRRKTIQTGIQICASRRKRKA